MALYSGPEDLLHDAASKGIINIRGLNLRVGSIEMQSPAIAILKPREWKVFLQNVVDNSDSDQEINCANMFLTLSLQVEHQHDMYIKNLRNNPINDQDVTNLTQELDKCNTVDEILTLINNNTIAPQLTQPKATPMLQQMPAAPPILQQMPAEAVKMKIEMIPDKLCWKRPINVNGKCRYFAHNLNWYIESQTSAGPNGGLTAYYSIFSPEGKELARFDKLKDAKNNMIPVIKQLG